MRGQNNNDRPINSNGNAYTSSMNPHNYNQINSGQPSFAQVLNSNDNISNKTLTNYKTLINKQIELTNTLLNMMSLLISKLCN